MFIKGCPTITTELAIMKKLTQTSQITYSKSYNQQEVKPLREPKSIHPKACALSTGAPQVLPNGFHGLKKPQVQFRSLLGLER